MKMKNSTSFFFVEQSTTARSPQETNINSLAQADPESSPKIETNLHDTCDKKINFECETSLEHFVFENSRKKTYCFFPALEPKLF